MKNIIYLVVLMFALPAFAQDSNNTITVVGETQKQVLDDSYIILITLQQIMVYEGQGEIEATSLDLVRENYIKKAEAAGIDFSKFKRNTYYEFAMSYSLNRQSACYYLKTSDKDEVRKIMQLKSAGVSIENVDMKSAKLTDQELVELSTLAIENARVRAEAIAGKLNKTIGEIVNISDANTSEQYVLDYGTSNTQAHSVSVSFELK